MRSDILVKLSCHELPIPAVHHNGAIDRTLVVEPAQELRSLPVLDRVVGTGGIASPVCPDDLRLSREEEREIERYRTIAILTCTPTHAKNTYLLYHLFQEHLYSRGD